MDISARVEEFQSRIVQVGGDLEKTTIIAVTKGFGPEAVRAAVNAGLNCVGENYAQEMKAKQAEVADLPVEWHFIGHLQRNKVKLVSAFTDVWQSLDSQPLIDEIAKRSPKSRVFVEVNLAGDVKRSGCAWSEAPQLVDWARSCGLNVEGLMGIGAFGDPEDSRLSFRKLAQLARQLELAEVSMGMSSDFEIAVQEGSTMIRIGSAFFGERA